MQTIESLANCQLRVLAVGGGGYGYIGGGGSGYIQYIDQRLDSKTTSIKLAVGDYQVASNVTIDNNKTITALPGRYSSNLWLIWFY